AHPSPGNDAGVRAEDPRDLPRTLDRASLRRRSHGHLYGQHRRAHRPAMTIILPALNGVVLVFLLTFARAGAMIMLLPVIGDAGVPVRVRLAFALAASLALVSLTTQFYPTTEPSPLLLATLIAREVTAGVLIGAMARLIMS